MMGEEPSQYQQFRLMRLNAAFDQQNNSAHFSLKDSNITLSDRVELNSARSSPHVQPNPNVQTLALMGEIAEQKRMHEELERKHSALMEKYARLEAQHEETVKELGQKEAENTKLRETLSMRKQLQRQTKKKLKNWVAQAKKGLNQ